MQEGECMEQCSEKCSNTEDIDVKSFVLGLNVFVIFQAHERLGYTSAQTAS